MASAAPTPLAEGHVDSFQNYIVDFDTFSERYLAQRLLRCHGEVDGGMDYPWSRLPPLGVEGFVRRLIKRSVKLKSGSPRESSSS